MGIKKQGPGRYLVRVTRRIDGVRMTRKKVCDSREEAKHVNGELEAELEALAQGEAPPERATLGDFAARWLERKAASLKPSTAAKYLTDLEQHLLPGLGARFLDELRPSDVERFLIADGGSANNRRNRLALLRQLAKASVAEGLANRNWTLTVRAPVPEGYSEDDPNLLTAAELARVLEAVPESWRALASVLAFTGLRWGEATALHWEDVVIDLGEPHNAHARIRRSNWRGVELTPKTRAGKRVVPLPPPLPELLVAQRQRLERAGLGECRWVFPSQEGAMLRATPLSKVLTAACKSAGVRRITVHGLRRTFNNLLRRVAEGIVTRSMLGHTNEAMTEHYSLVDLAEKHAAAAAVATAVAGGLSGVPTGVAAPAGTSKT